MSYTQHIWSAFFVFFLLALSTHCHASDPIKEHKARLTYHYIIAFDQSIGKYRPYYLDKSILQTIDNLLEINGFNKNRDYLSMVAYTLEAGNPSMDRFVRPYEDADGEIIWIHPGDKGISERLRNWPTGQPILDFSAQPFGSMQSLAKPYAIMETVRDDHKNEKADKTILLIVSDEVINGIDDNYAQEWRNISTIPGANYQAFIQQSKEVFERVKDFNEEFNFLQIPLLYSNKFTEHIPVSSDGVYKIIPYELVSTEKPSVHSVTDLPSPLPFKRVKGGYALTLDSLYVAPHHSVEEFTILSLKGDTLVNSHKLNGEFFVPGSKLANGDSIRIHMNLSLIDGMYNGMLMTPNNSRYPGLENRQKIRLANDYQILGFIPLADWMWPGFMSNDMLSVIMAWDILIVVILIIFLLILGYWSLKRIATYIPKDEDVKIHHL